MLGKDVSTGEIKPLMLGDEVFRLLDTHGMQLGEIVDALREQGLGFDIEGFIRAARDSGNYTEYRTTQTLLQEAPEPLRLLIPTIVEKVWRKG